jgi:hypothetical protein
VNSPVEGNVESFIKTVQANGARVRISATYSPPERAYLVHYAWMVAHGQVKYGAYPTDDPLGR